MVANLEPITGKDGYIAMLNGASTPMTAEPCGNVTSFPGGAMTYPANQIYSVTARAHKVLDPKTPLIVKNAGVIVAKTQYKVLYGSGIILFRTPLAAPGTITLDGAYIVTATGTDVVGIDHVNDWVLNLTAAQVPADEYGVDIIPELRGKYTGTWQFARHSSSSGLDLFYQMLLQDFFIFALYEELQSNRIWVIYGDLTASPQNAPGGAVASGTVTGTLRQLPSFLNEALVA